MHRTIASCGVFAMLILLMLTTSCSDKTEYIAESDNADVSDMTELESAESYAEKARAEGSLENGDIIIVYDTETMAACCFECAEGNVKLMYNGDYKGSYAKLECVFRKDYDLWSVMAYRKTQGDTSEVMSDEYDDLAQHIMNEYLEKYGTLRAGSFICFSCDGEYLAQYATLSDGSVEQLKEDDVRFDMWQYSENADDYWAKLVHDDAEGLCWEVYEYDKQCSKAFDEIVDAIDAISEKMSIPDGSIFICQRNERKIAMRYYSEGVIVFVQPADLDALLSAVKEQDKSDFRGIPKNVTFYFPEVKE